MARSNLPPGQSPPNAIPMNWKSPLPVGLVLALAAFAACSTSTSGPTGSGGGQPVSCTKSTDCPTGYGCGTTGVCGTQCSADGDCNSEQECTAGVCTNFPAGSGGSKSAGASSSSGSTCIKVTCKGVGAACGMVPDGCGAKLDCGGCTAPETCGGSGTPNKCGAPASCVTNNDCTKGDNCCTGLCTSLLGDPNNCGACMAACLPGQSCMGGMCL